MLKKQSLLVACALLSACLNNTAALEPRAQGVKIVNEMDRPLHCKTLGKISGTSRSSDAKEARKGAENDFRNQAAELKGNFALITAERHGPVGTSSQEDFFIGGKALFCQTEEMEEANEKAEAKAKEQKEKAEADRQQQEADEKKQKDEGAKEKKSKK